MLGATFCLLYPIMVVLGYGGNLFKPSILALCVDLLILLILGIGAMVDQHRARLALSILLPLQACWVIAYIVDKVSSAGGVCDFSCLDGPLEAIALPIALTFVAAWVIYPGWKRPTE